MARSATAPFGVLLILFEGVSSSEDRIVKSIINCDEVTPMRRIAKHSKATYGLQRIAHSGTITSIWLL